MVYVPSTARSFRDGTPINCPLQRTWSLVFTPFQPGIVPWHTITQPLRHASSTSFYVCFLNLNVCFFSYLIFQFFFILIGVFHEADSDQFVCLLESNVALTSEVISPRCLLVAVVLWPSCCYTGTPCRRHRTWHPNQSQYTDTGPFCHCAIHWSGTSH